MPNRNKAKIKASRHRTHKIRRGRKNETVKDSEPCLLIVDVPNVNSVWYEKKLNYGGCAQGVDFPYERLFQNCIWHLKRRYPNKLLHLEAVLFINQRPGTDMSLYHELAESPDWTLFCRPKVEDSDIDENILQCLDFYLQEKPFLHVFLVGNDLRNYWPIAARMARENIGVTILSFFEYFKETTIRSIKTIQGYDVFNIKGFIKLPPEKAPSET